jgi:hypothetical protein
MTNKILTVLFLGVWIGFSSSGATVTFKLNENGDPTDGGAHPDWSPSGSSYQKTTSPLFALYDVDIDGDSTNDVSVELSSPTPGAAHLMLSGASAGGITLDGNVSGGINADEVLRIRFGKDVVINGFVLAAFGSGESADYTINGSVATATNATISGLSVTLPAGGSFDLQLTNPSGSDAFRLKTLSLTIAGESRSYAPKGNYVRLRPLQNRGTSGIDDDYWQYDDYTAQDVLKMIEKLQPTELERYISGPFNPDTLVPVDSGEPPMTVAEFLNASMAAGAPGCTISPRVSLEVLWNKDCPWSTEFTNCFYAVADNLYNLPIDPPIRTISLDNWGGFSKTYSDEVIEGILTNLVAMGWERIAANYIGGNRNSYGIVKVGMFGVDHDTYDAKMSAYDAIVANESIEDVLLYIDFRNPAEAFSTNHPDFQAAELYEIAAAQVSNDYTFVYPVIGADFWDVNNVFTSSNGPYGGMSLFDVMVDAMRTYNQVHKPLMNTNSSGTNGLSISWPEWGEGYQLYSATSLVADAAWNALTNEPVVHSGECSVELHRSKAQEFFKLEW